MTLLKITWPGLLVLFFHSVATYFGWYENLYWLDTPMHFAGGVSIGIAAYWLIGHSKLESRNFHPKIMQFLLILSLTALAAVVWEVLEFNFDWFFHTQMQPGIVDTMKDLCMGLSGSAVVAIIVINKKNRP